MKLRFLWIAAVMVVSFSLTAFSLPKYTQICSLFSSVNGWSIEDSCSGMNAENSMNGSFVTAEQTYINNSNNNEKYTALVMVGSKATMMWMPFATAMTVDTPDSHVEVKDLDGYRMGISMDKQSNSGSVMVCLDKSQTSCKAIFAVNFENMGYSKAVELLKNFDLEAISDLVK